MERQGVPGRSSSHGTGKAGAGGGPAPAHPALALQRQAGNRATRALLEGAQAPRQLQRWGISDAMEAVRGVVSNQKDDPGGPGNRPFLKFGDKGKAVVALQVKLKIMGFNLPATGYFGTMTLDAVKKVQAGAPEVGTPDGFVGGGTWDVLDGGVAKSAARLEAVDKEVRESSFFGRIEREDEERKAAWDSMSSAEQARKRATWEKNQKPAPGIADKLESAGKDLVGKGLKTTGSKRKFALPQARPAPPEMQKAIRESMRTGKPPVNSSFPISAEIARALPEAGKVKKASLPGHLIAIGPAINGAAVVGRNASVGFYIDDHGTGYYGSLGHEEGLDVGFSATISISIVKGDHNRFSGTGSSVGFSAGEAFVGGAAALFDSNDVFFGISVSGGGGAGIPVNLYKTASETWVTEAE